jgi:hypothetical protein
LFYIIRLGFLDGKAGYTYGRLLSQYEYQIGVKLYELRQFGGQLNVSATPSEHHLNQSSRNPIEIKVPAFNLQTVKPLNLQPSMTNNLHPVL